MKMSAAHYAELKARVERIGIDKLREHRAHLEQLHRHTDLRYSTVKDPAMRFLWDAFHASRIARDLGPQNFDYKDAHIETAMRSIFKELGL